MNDFFVIGSAYTLSNLTREECQYINNNISIGFNKYLMFFDYIGIIPNYYLVIDYTDEDNLKYMLSNDPGVETWFLNKSYQKLWNIDYPNKNIIWLKDTQDQWLGKDSKKRFHFSDSLDKPLLHFRSTLTDVINCIYIIAPGSKIKLLGCEGKGPYFFEDNCKKEELHRTHKNFKGTRNGVLDIMPFLRDKMRETGGDIVNCSPTSIAVEKGILEYEEIII